MLNCPHCGDMLERAGDTVIACACDGARQADIEDKHRRAAFRLDYQKAVDEQRALERKNKKR